MATPGSSSTLARLKPKKPLDVWSTREKLCLASAVFKIGDQNWLSVSRAIKPYADANRPAEWFHQKNCVVQYYDMLEQLEQPKRKRGEKDRSESDPPSLQIMRKMTIERSEQLRKEIVEMQHQFKYLQNEVEEINAGVWDDRIKDEWETIQASDTTQEKMQVKTEIVDDDSKLSVTDQTDIGELDDTTQDSLQDVSLTDDDSMQASSSSFLTSTPVATSSPMVEVAGKSSAASQLLSSLLKSNVKSATGLQQLKREQEQVEIEEQANQSVSSQDSRSLLQNSGIQRDLLSTTASSSQSVADQGSDSAVLETANVDLMAHGDVLAADTEVVIEETVVETTQEVKTEIIEPDTPSGPAVPLEGQSAEAPDSHPVPAAVEVEEVVCRETSGAELVKEETTCKDSSADLDVEGLDLPKEDTEKDSQDEEDESVGRKHIDRLPSEADSSIKDEPLSPTSSIGSRISETGSKRGSRGKGRPRSARGSRGGGARKSVLDDGGSSRHSDVELSEDEVRESEDLVGGNLSSVHASSILSESFPNSPASLSMCSDTEEEKSFKQWKKSIMLVWRAASTHKYANVFVHPVTNEIAPGYGSVVLRPIDLTTIKKNVENGVLRTTSEFQRDMMLMFTNAIMYNSSDHNVYRMAQEMYDDVMNHIEIMMQTTDAKNLRQCRRPDAPEKEEDPKKRRLSVDQSEGGKTKKRKGRADEPVP